MVCRVDEYCPVGQKVYNGNMTTHAKESASLAVLLALIPYAEQSRTVAFHPSDFFDYVERTSGYPRTTLQQSYSRLKARGLLTTDALPRLTVKGRRYVQPYIAKVGS